MIGEISTLFGLRVYTDEGRYVGKVDDVLIDIDQRLIKGLAVGDYNKSIIDSKAPGVIIPYRLVKSVNDIVIIKDVFKLFKERRKREEYEESYGESYEEEEYEESYEEEEYGFEHAEEIKKEEF
ncbi:MAG: PRC-barrel domain-containing protein [Archaeoglobus sp.]|nr:PRC-barrel domain-containing protein [Archaeoglobus sp.]